MKTLARSLALAVCAVCGVYLIMHDHHVIGGWVIVLSVLAIANS